MRPLPSTRWLRQSTAAGSTSPISTASLSRIRARGRIWTNPNSRGRPGRDRQVHRELDLDRRAHPALPLLHEGRQQVGERKPPLLQDRGEGHEPRPRAREPVVDGVVLGRVGRGDARQRAVRLGGREVERLLAHPAVRGPALEGKRPELALGRLQHVLDRGELEDVVRVARAEPDAHPALDDRAAHAERDRHHPVPRLHGRRGVEVVGAGHPGEVRVEPPAPRRPHDPLEDHRHLLLLQPVGGRPEVRLRVLREGRGVDALDRQDRPLDPLADAPGVVRQHQRVVDAGERLVLRVLEQARGAHREGPGGPPEEGRHVPLRLLREAARRGSGRWISASSSHSIAK